MKAALITGASSGIGQATALELGQQGYFIYLMGRNRQRLETVASDCKSGASILSCELTNIEAVKQRMHEVLNHKINKLEILVNNAGVFNRNTQETDFSTTEALWNEQFQVNLLAAVRLVHHVFPYFQKQGQGSIVNISSTLGLKPTADTSAYSAIKAAMINWTQSLALEGGKYNIRANCVCPGLVDTPIHSFFHLPPEEHLKAKHQLRLAQPLGRIGTPQEIAKAIAFLATPSSSWTTGAVLSVDGGINLK